MKPRLGTKVVTKMWRCVPKMWQRCWKLSQVVQRVHLSIYVLQIHQPLRTKRIMGWHCYWSDGAITKRRFPICGCLPVDSYSSYKEIKIMPKNYWWLMIRDISQEPVTHTEVKDRDQKWNKKGKEYADRKRKAEDCDLMPGDKMLTIWKRKIN